MSLVENKNVEINKNLLTIKVDADKFEGALERAYRKNVKKIDIHGFRKGKAPRKMIEKMYGEGFFFDDAINELYPAALSEAILESKLEVVARPEVEVTDASKAEGFTFTAACVTKPEVVVNQYKGIAAEKTTTIVSDEDIDKKLEDMRQKAARMVDIDDRAAQDGDTVIFDFEGFVDGVAFEGGQAHDFSLVLGSGQFIPGFEPQIVGQKIDEEFEVNVSFPEEYHVDELKGKPAVFKCCISAIQVKQLPELDDEFVMDTTEFEKMDELVADLKAKATEANESQAASALENDLIDVIIENMEATVPDEMIEVRIDDMIRDFEYRLQSQGINVDTYLQYTGMDIDSFRATFKVQAEKQVKIRLALEKIVEMEDITIDEETINAEYVRLAELYKMEVEKVKTYIPEAELIKDLAVNKAVDLVKDSAQVTEKTVTTAELKAKVEAERAQVEAEAKKAAEEADSED